MRQFAIQVVQWRARLEPAGIDADLHYSDSDGRLLSVVGHASLLRIPSGLDRAMQMLLAITHGGITRCEVSFHQARSREAVEADCDGFACLYDDGGGHSEMLGASIDLPPHLWEELWMRSRSPPPECLVRFSIVGLDVGPGTVDLMPTNRNFRVVHPCVT